ncbi:hypothetical protein L7F22_045892 [Adiantum nelumboides]|nr:hypothetical protein [Adiantum nelumboides]
MTAHVFESNAHLEQLRTQIATFGHLQGGPTATIPYKTTNFSSEEKEYTELAVNNWLHQWTTYFDLHKDPDERRIQTIPLYLRTHSSCTDCTFSTKVFDKHDLLRFPRKINGHDVTVLLDNGSSHNFVDAKLVQELNLQTQASDHEYRVKMARGEDTDVWNQIVPHLQLELANYKENLDFHIMRLDRTDVVLGIPWFYDKQDSLYIDYVHHSLVFVKQHMPHVSVSLCNQISVNNSFAIRVVTALEMFKDTKSSEVDFYQCVPSTWFDSLVLGTFVTEFCFFSLFSDSMADKGKDKLRVEESSSSTVRHRRETATANTQFMASARTAARTARAPRPSMTAEEQEKNDLFTAQLMSMMGTFEQLAKNPRMQKLLKTKDYRTGSQAETSQQATSRQRQVTELVERVPTVVTRPVQHVTQAQDPARNGHRSNEQSTHPTIPMHASFPGYFGARNPIKVKGQVAFCVGNSAGFTQEIPGSVPLKMGPFGFDLGQF